MFCFGHSIILTHIFCSLLAAPPSVSNLHITGDAVEGNILRGVGEYFGGKEGPSKFEWLREEKDTGLVSFTLCYFHHEMWSPWSKHVFLLPFCLLCRESMLVLMGTNEYSLTKEDVGRRLAFVYIPVNFEGKLIYILQSLSLLHCRWETYNLPSVSADFRTWREAFVSCISDS